MPKLTLTPNVAAELRATHPASTAALQAIQDKRQAAHRTTVALTDDEQEHRQEVAYGRSRIAGLDPRRAGPAIELEKARIAPHEAEIERLQPAKRRAAETLQVYAAVADACLEWLGDHRDGRYRDVPPPVVEKPAGGWPQAVEEQRGRLAGLRDRRGAVEKAPRSVAEAVEQVKAHVARLRETGAPDVKYLLRPGGGVSDIRWPETNSYHRKDGGGTARTRVPDVPAILAWLYGKDLEAALVAEIEAAAGSQATETLTDAERARLLAELDAEILQAERIEESMIRAAAVEGLEILRRPDADPRAVLSVEER